MPTSDDTYRQALREKMGLKGNKPIKEEDVPQQPVASAKAPVAGGEVQTEEQLDPQAESIINEVLQHVHDKVKDQKTPPQTLKMVMKLYSYIDDDKEKICRIMVKGAK